MNEVVFGLVMASLTISGVSIVLGSMQRRYERRELERARRLARIEGKLDVLLRQGGLAFDEYAGVPPAVADALRRGETLLAIKLLREASGMDLASARAYVEQLKSKTGE